jgi:hypothetical protein
LSQSITLRYALTLSVLAGFLAGCGGSQPPIGVVSLADGSKHARMHRRTFNYTGKAQWFKVPANITQITVGADGASGPSGQPTNYCKFTGGNGGIIKATIPVTPGERLAIYVGGEGGGDGSDCTPNDVGGFNGGGYGGNGVSGGSGSGGGGASDVREGGNALTDRVVVAGGGGGGGVFNGLYGAGSGGAGGGKIGGSGSVHYSGSPAGNGGTGGTQHRGGRGGKGPERYSFGEGMNGHHGKLGVGGAGGGGASDYGGSGGGGGGGYYGGGGGQAGSHSTSGVGGGGGGGGGSSYVERSATHIKNQRGAAPPGNGEISISWLSE